MIDFPRLRDLVLGALQQSEEIGEPVEAETYVQAIAILDAWKEQIARSEKEPVSDSPEEDILHYLLARNILGELATQNKLSLMWSLLEALLEGTPVAVVSSQEELDALQQELGFSLRGLEDDEELEVEVELEGSDPAKDPTLN